MLRKSLLRNQLMVKVWELQKVQLEIIGLRQQISSNVEPEFETLALTEKEAVYFSQNRIVCLTREAQKLMAKHMEALSEMPRVGHSPETKEKIMSLAATLRDLANIWEGVAMR